MLTHHHQRAQKVFKVQYLLLLLIFIIYTKGSASDSVRHTSQCTSTGGKDREGRAQQGSLYPFDQTNIWTLYSSCSVTDQS